VIRVLVVDDSTFVRQALSRMLGSQPDIEVVGTAIDGQDGYEKVLALRPDVVTLDVKMPRMGGLEALSRIMAECPTPVLLLSSLTSEGGDVTLRGLELGAMDFVDKSSVQGHMNLLSLSEELQAKVRALASVPRGRLRVGAASAAAAAPAPALVRRPVQAEVVVIGTSTGGPPALQALIPRFPEGLGSAILVVQHMPVGFTRSLAERLDARSVLRVREAQDEEPVLPGVVLVAPAGVHMKVRRRGPHVRVWLDEEPRGALHRPSVDVLMASVAKIYGRKSLGVVLTGMGSDGVEGLRAIRLAGGRTLAESEESCVIYGMPKAAVEAGVVDHVVPLPRMADEILATV
jgi:two-component system, chemotaxis family, protein-glutamate methylesterase/glutaminase